MIPAISNTQNTKPSFKRIDIKNIPQDEELIRFVKWLEKSTDMRIKGSNTREGMRANTLNLDFFTDAPKGGATLRGRTPVVEQDVATKLAEKSSEMHNVEVKLINDWA